MPIRRVDGFRIADSKADLLTNGNANTFQTDQRGEHVSGNLYAFTSTFGGGTGSLDTTCLDWTTSSGQITLLGETNIAYTEEWTESFAGNCSDSGRLLCFSNREVLFWDGFELSGDTVRWSATVP